MQNKTPESDPLGKDQHTPGAKLDADKNRLGLVLGDFSRALEAVGWVGTFGAKKYSARGWLEVPSADMRYRDALMRHLFADFRGEEIDPQTNLDHFAHLAWNALAILELKLRERERRRKFDESPPE